MLDQALFAGANFVVNVLLARWLTPSDYGAFAVSYSIFLLAATAHTALLTEPMLVLGAGRFSGALQPYLRRLTVGHFWVTGTITVTSLAMLGAAWWGGVSGTATPALLALCLSAPAILLLWLARRACYIESRAGLAAAAGAAYLLLMVMGAYGLQLLGALSSLTAFPMIGLCSLLCSVWIMRKLGAHRREASHVDVGELRRAHWHYGRWALATGALSWVPANIFLVVLPRWESLASVGLIKAVMNLVMPVLQANAAISILLLPVLVRARGTGAFRQVSRTAGLLFTGAAAVYWLLIGLGGREVSHWMYGAKYEIPSHLLWLAGGLPLTAGLGLVFGGVLRACERPDLVFRAYVVASIFALTGGLALTAVAGVTGALLALLASSAVTATVMGFLGKRMSDGRGEAHP